MGPRDDVELYEMVDGDIALVGDFEGTGDFTETTDTLCLEDGCYALLALDSWGRLEWRGTSQPTHWIRP